VRRSDRCTAACSMQVARALLDRSFDVIDQALRS